MISSSAEVVSAEQWIVHNHAIPENKSNIPRISFDDDNFEHL